MVLGATCNCIPETIPETTANFSSNLRCHNYTLEPGGDSISGVVQVTGSCDFQNYAKSLYYPPCGNSLGTALAGMQIPFPDTVPPTIIEHA